MANVKCISARRYFSSLSFLKDSGMFEFFSSETFERVILNCCMVTSMVQKRLKNVNGDRTGLFLLVFSHIINFHTNSITGGDHPNYSSFSWFILKASHLHWLIFYTIIPPPKHTHTFNRLNIFLYATVNRNNMYYKFEPFTFL